MKRFPRMAAATKTVADAMVIKAGEASAFILLVAVNLAFSPVQAVLVLGHLQTFRTFLSRFAAFMRLFSP